MGQKISIDVCDNGPGIPPSRREAVFLPFLTSKPNGSGIGLALAKQILVAQGGSVAFLDAARGARLCTALLAS